MAQTHLHEIPARDPISGQKLVVTELTTEDGSVTIKGRFKVPAIARLEQNHQDFLDVFLRARGVISTVEKELGISYPTVRARLDSLLEALELHPIKPRDRRPEETELKRSILAQLEEGTITADEAKAKLKGAAQ
jgi:hypothetical protein